MRDAFSLIVGVFLLAPAAAHAQIHGAIGGFAGMTVTTDLSAADVGGTATFAATPHIHFIGEAGRIANVMPPLSVAILSLTGVGVRASAVYGEGGVRLLASPGSTVSPYGEATAGVARLNLSMTGLGPLSGYASALALATTLLDRSGTVAGLGAGLLFHAGPVLIDVGYRYKQIFAPEPLQAVLGLGQELRSQQVRAGIGVKF